MWGMKMGEYWGGKQFLHGFLMAGPDRFPDHSWNRFHAVSLGRCMLFVPPIFPPARFVFFSCCLFVSSCVRCSFFLSFLALLVRFFSLAIASFSVLTMFAPTALDDDPTARREWERGRAKAHQREPVCLKSLGEKAQRS